MCLRCPAMLPAHAAYITRSGQWEWRYSSWERSGFPLLCYRCRRSDPPPEPVHRVYAVWFPGVKVLKVGHTTQTNDNALLRGKNTAAQRTDGRLIWSGPGGLAEESFIQAYFQLRGYRPWKVCERRTQMSEWVKCPYDTVKTLESKLTDIYAYIQRIKND